MRDHVAVHDSGCGTSRRFVVTRKFDRYWRYSRPERAFSPDQLGRKWPSRDMRGSELLLRRKMGIEW